MEYRVQWKSVAALFGVSVRTVQRWAKVIPLPHRKSHPSKSGRIVTPEHIIPKWFDALCQVMPFLNKYRKNLNDALVAQQR